MSKSKSPIQQNQIIVTNIQVYLLLSVAMTLGIIFGIIFGIVDVEDYYKNKVILYVVLEQEISLCEPIGAIFGAFAGFMIDFLR